MKFFGNKLVRAIAFITACVLIASSAFAMTDILIISDKSNKTDEYYNMEASYSQEESTLFERLWTVANMYMRNLDSGGKFAGNKYLQASTEEAMKELGLMDSKGNVTIDGDENFEYILKYNDNTLTNTDRKEKDFSKDYSYIQKNDVENYPAKLRLHRYCDMSWYTTNFGMTYFNIRNLSEKSIAIFDFDTKGLPYYYDENGAKIYYKEDGSTPVPKKNDGYYYNEYDSQFDIYGNNIPISTDDKFEYISGDDRPICIFLKPKDNVITKIETAQNEYKALENELEKKAVGVIPPVAAAAVLGLFFIVMGGYDTEQKKFVLRAPNNIFTEFYLVLIFIALFGAGAFLASFDEIKELFSEKASSMPVFYAAAYGALFAVGLYAVNAIVVQLKCKGLFRTSLIGRGIIKTVNGIKGMINNQMLRNDAMTRKFVIRTAVAVTAEIFMLFVLGRFSFGFVFLFFLSLVNLAAYVILSIRDFEDMNKLGEHISAMKSGDYTKVKVPETSVTYGMTKNLNEISDGMQTAVEKRVQSERMKIDLVTNVSHDLKTPLTSIISYIDLLGSEEMSPEAKDYVGILEEKSARLKAIVSDLFDLAKATSGTDIVKDKLDAAILVQQVIGDMNDKIEKYGKDLRSEIKDEPIPVMGDGKKLYRVIQNLVDNSLKYSLDGTRIYITVYKEKPDAVITVKNISAEEMNFTAEEITERFARGDSSRSSEGSGLGLSIAKSFTEANGGNFNVLLDGDMFTAEVRLPLQAE